ncbi:MAG: hypothetical protein MUE73_12610 [Planctomycetes bacterium]|jgi:hypothetical protein|nr:hypothetical protein [Planctomycetota bacterium]
MASIMRLRPPAGEMDRILNVDQRVGPLRDCPNLPGDVEAVQRLVALAVTEFASGSGFPLPQPTGRFDVLTGFYVYHLQARQQARYRTVVVDGVVSPARGSVYGGGIWTIVNFNNIVFLHNRPEWEALLRRFANRPADS